MRKPDRRGKATTSKLLVVDASVLRAAGSEAAIHPCPIHCRNVLQDILEICHRVAVSEPVKTEWAQHSSRFARIWTKAMYASRKIVVVKPTDCADVSQGLRQSSELSEQQVEAGEKDMHLIAVARASDHTILSLDDAAGTIMRTLTKTTRVIAHLVWINPDKDNVMLRTWLSTTESAPTHWRLGPVTPLRSR